MLFRSLDGGTGSWSTLPAGYTSWTASSDQNTSIIVTDTTNLPFTGSGDPIITSPVQPSLCFTLLPFVVTASVQSFSSFIKLMSAFNCWKSVSTSGSGNVSSNMSAFSFALLNCLNPLNG